MKWSAVPRNVVLHQWVGCIDRLLFLLLLVGSSLWGAPRKNQREKRVSEHLLSFSLWNCYKLSASTEDPQLLLGHSAISSPQILCCPLWFLHALERVPLLNSSKIVQFECAISGSSKTLGDTLRLRYPGIKTPVESGGIETHLNTLGEGKDRSKSLGADSSLGIDWGTFSQLKKLSREHGTISTWTL